jgi:hypothetical protein
MAFEIDMATFWSDWGVTCGNQSANNRYDCFYGLTMNDGFVCSNAKDFFDWNETNRYDFYKYYETVSGTPPVVYDEFTFYKNTNDVNIYDFKTFYEYAPSYFPAQCLSNNFVFAYKNNSTVYKSYDGINWSEITTDVMLDYEVNENCNTSNSNYIIMGGINNIIRYDIVNDTWENFAQTITFDDLAYNSIDDLFIGISRNTSTNNVHLSSDNGENWVTYSSGFNFDCIGYQYGGNQYYASIQAVSNTRVSTSPDGINWTTHVTSTGGAATTDSFYLDSVDVNGDIFFIPTKPTVGNNKWVLKTNDFITWDQYNFTFDGNWRCASFNPTNDNVVLMGKDPYLSAWNSFPAIVSSNAPTTYNYTDNCYYPFFDEFIAVTNYSEVTDDDKRILYSINKGENWIKVSGTSGNFTNVFVV